MNSQADFLNCKFPEPEEIELDETDLSHAKKKVDDMCKKLLANLIIEDYKINKI